MSDRWLITVPVINTAHLQERTFAALVGDILRGRWAGAAGPDQVWVYVPEVARGADPEGKNGQFPADLYGVFAWAMQNGHEYIRLDAHGDRVEDLPTYDWGADNSEDRQETYHRYDLYTQTDDTIRGQTETNDDNDDGIPDDIERWDVSFKDRDEALRRTGGSHIGINGCKVEVFIDGVKV